MGFKIDNLISNPSSIYTFNEIGFILRLILLPTLHHKNVWGFYHIHKIDWRYCFFDVLHYIQNFLFTLSSLYLIFNIEFVKLSLKQDI